MGQEITSINQILPNAPAGGFNFNDTGEKAQVVKGGSDPFLTK